MMAQQDYSKLDFFQLDKLITDLTEEKNEINKNLKRGYEFRYIKGSRQRVELPQFSEEYNSLLNQAKELDQQIQSVTNAASIKAKAYKPIPGPTNVFKEERALVEKFAKAKVVAGPPAPAQQPPKPATLQDVIASNIQANTGATSSTATAGAETTQPVPTPVKTTTSPTGTTVTTTKKKGGPKAPVAVQENWIDAMQRIFPSYSDDWLAANAETYFGKDVVDFMRKVSDPKGVYDLNSAAGIERIKAELRGTNYWQTTITAIKEFDQLVDADKANLITQTKSRIANTYGDLGLSDQLLNEVATTVARTGLTGLGEKQAVYNTAFRATNSQSQTGRALSGFEADRIRRIGRAYNFKVTDDQVQSILTGTPEAVTGQVLTEEGLRQRLQKFARGAYPQLADQIDAGLSLEDVGANYRRYAADLLERSEDEIDMFSGPYLKAFGSKDGGQLSLSEWVSTVKSDPSFGWQFTKQANQQATDIGLTLARAFGKVG
jgi:hypothetical protein